MIATLGQGRRHADEATPADVRETEASGRAEFLLAVPFGINLVALLVEGVIALLN
ncbi:hypothetical protein ACFWP7_08060 [Streptomyces sp. NPDC058470]|uniref:hypothetical protein n=1 Tax=Streptomyces sp. NPDC058470 TaxID=3346515 RepID=UPI003665F741